MKTKMEPAHKRVGRIITYACLIVIFGVIFGLAMYYLMAWIVRISQ